MIRFLGAMTPGIFVACAGETGLLAEPATGVDCTVAAEAPSEVPNAVIVPTSTAVTTYLFVRALKLNNPAPLNPLRMQPTHRKTAE